MRSARVLPLIALLITAACSAPRAAAPTAAPAASGTAAASATPSFEGKTLNIVTGGTGGVYIVLGAGLADLLSKKMKISASAQQTTASVDNMKFIGQGKADLAFTLADTAFDAMKGNAPFTDKVDAQAIAVIYGNYTHIVVKADSGINSIADLKGKRVSVGAAGSGTEIIANRVLESYGIDASKDISRERLAAADSANAVRDGKLDGFFFSGGLPVGAISDLANSVSIKLLSDTDAIKKMSDKYGPFYVPGKVPAGTYKGVPETTVSSVQNLLVVNAKFDPAFVRAILQTMFDNKSDLEIIHPAAKEMTLQTASIGSPLPFNQGAIDFYKAKGVWKG
ncbi:MAG TPA: TAXI family TRAP transporter solute-binding subunit [Candidatus Acidoferrales bacterium]|nr:TAXI family TRAP transporter solute-binding subunit [Candidatus Acidoferrales bacterium]